MSTQRHLPAGRRLNEHGWKRLRFAEERKSRRRAANKTGSTGDVRLETRDASIILFLLNTKRYQLSTYCAVMRQNMTRCFESRKILSLVQRDMKGCLAFGLGYCMYQNVGCYDLIADRYPFPQTCITNHSLRRPVPQILDLPWSDIMP